MNSFINMISYDLDIVLIELHGIAQYLLRELQDRMWKELWESSDFERRQAEVKRFNQENRWRKRGMAQMPTKFGISFTAKFMNQAG